MFQKLSLDSLERIWARSTGHVLGETDTDIPTTPILTRIEARVSLVIRTGWVAMHVVTCFFVVSSIIHHW